MKIPLLIGTYSVRGSAGLYGTLFDADTGSLDPPHPLLPPKTLFNPTYLTVCQDRLYSTGETGFSSSQGQVALFRIESDGPKIQPLAAVPCGQGSPCHVCCFDQGRRLVASHYKTGELYFFRLDPVGIPSLETVFRQPGRGPVPSRQESSHFHAATASPDGRWLVAADLGQDALFLFEIESEALRFVARISCPPASGPRHLVYSPDSRFLWATGELDSSILSFRQDNGSLSLILHQSVRPPFFTGENYPAEIRLHPDGRTLFVSNRGADEIVILQTDPSGALQLLGRHATVSWPRGMILSPDGRFLLAGSQHQDEIAIYSISADRTTLEEHKRIAKIPSPVAFAFGSIPVTNDSDPPIPE